MMHTTSMRVLIAATSVLLCASAPAPAFDLADFHKHAAAFHHDIISTPVCVGHEGVRGQFVMEVPIQEGLSFSVTTIANGRGIYSNLTTGGDDSLSEAAAADVGAVFNDQAEVIITKIIADCKNESA